MQEQGQGAVNGAEEKLQKSIVQLAAYRKIIEKYADQINSFEVKSVPELKNLINPSEAAVKKVKENLLVEFQKKSGREYAESDLPRVGLAAFHFISSLRVIGAELPVSYWFSPSQVLEIGAADAFDRAIFLCSLLNALGCANSKIHVLEVEGGLRHPVVIAKIAENHYLFDAMPPSQFIKATNQQGLLAAYEINGKKYTRSLFEFSAAGYEEFEYSVV